eukprot:jgi/Ulvmu1/10351/UM061_0034.1
MSRPSVRSQLDQYGFSMSLTPSEDAARKKCTRKAQKREERDWAFETTHNSISSTASHANIKQRCRKGVPPKLRPMVWMAVSGAAHLRAQYVASYFITCATLPVTNADHEAHIKQIELDVTRTFPAHPYFKERHGQQALTMTLRAYATHDPVVGYCQSMNYVAAFLLLVLNKDAEQAFWVLVVLLQGKLLHGTYDRSLTGCLQEVRVLDRLIAQKLPALSKHLVDSGTDLVAITPQWFLSLFCQDLPSETTARVFDALLLEGSKVLHRVALAVFKLAEPHLLRCRDTVACANALRVMLRHMHDRDALIRTALRRVGSLPMATIVKLRAAQAPDTGLLSRLLRLRAKRSMGRLKPTPWQCNLEIASAMQRSFSSAATGHTHTRSVPVAIDVLPETLPDPASRRHSRSRADTASSHHSPQRSVGAAPTTFPPDAHFPDTPLAGRAGTEFTMDSSTAMSPASDARGGDATASLDDRTLKLVQMQQALDNASLFREMEVESHMLFNFTVVRGGTTGSVPDPAPASGGSSLIERWSDRSAAALRTGSMRSPRGLPKPAPAASVSGSTVAGMGFSGGMGHLAYGPPGPSAASTRGGRSGDAVHGDTPSSMTASIVNLPGPPQLAQQVLHGAGDTDAVPAHAEHAQHAEHAEHAAPMWRITPEGLVRAGGPGLLEERLPGVPRSRGERTRWPALAGGAELPPPSPLLPPRQRAAGVDGGRCVRARSQHLLGDDSMFLDLGSAVGAPFGLVSSRSSAPPLSNAEMWVTAAESFGPGELSGPASGSGTLRDGSLTLQISK